MGGEEAIVLGALQPHAAEELVKALIRGAHVEEGGQHTEHCRLGEAAWPRKEQRLLALHLARTGTCFVGKPLTTLDSAHVACFGDEGPVTIRPHGEHAASRRPEARPTTARAR